MRITTLLNELAENLSSPDNEILSKAESTSDEVLVRVADALVSCAEILKMAAEDTDELEPEYSVEQLEEMAEVATAFDESGDPLLKKQASVLDEILLTIGSKKNSVAAIKAAEEKEIDRLRAKYHSQNGEDLYTKARESHAKEIGVEEARTAINKKVKKYRPLEAPLSSRYSPDMPGVQLMRVADGIYQCPITKKLYNFRSGFKTMKGNEVPGSSVENQTQYSGFENPEHSNFATRQEALNEGR